MGGVFCIGEALNATKDTANEHRAVSFVASSRDAKVAEWRKRGLWETAGQAQRFVRLFAKVSSAAQAAEMRTFFRVGAGMYRFKEQISPSQTKSYIARAAVGDGPTSPPD